MTYNALDAVFLIVIFLFAVSAMAKGLINEVFGKASFIISVVVALVFTPVLEVYVLDTIRKEAVAKVLSFLIIFVMAFLVIRIVQTILKKVFSGSILKGLDRALGLCLGLAEGVAVVAFVVFVLKAQPWFDTGGLLKGSLFARLFGGIVEESAQKVHSMAV